MTAEPLSTEQKLAAVIEAKKAGGCDSFAFVFRRRAKDGLTDFRWDDDLRSMVRRDDPFNTPVFLLEILLDPQGLRAAYGEHRVAYGVSFHRPGELQKDAAFTLGDDADSFLGRRIPDSDGAWTDTPAWLAAGQDILHAWLSTHLGDPKAAIDTAYSLLPAR